MVGNGRIAEDNTAFIFGGIKTSSLSGIDDDVDRQVVLATHFLFVSYIFYPTDFAFVG